MKIDPVFDYTAPPQIKDDYLKLKNALDSQTLPVFFTYIGAFPEYLHYITNQLIKNLEENSFKRLSLDVSKNAITKVHQNLHKSENIQEWIARYKSSPAFYHFQNNLIHIIRINTNLAFIFIALREAVKGWAVAARKLPGTHERKQQKESEDLNREEFIFDSSLYFSQESSSENKTDISTSIVHHSNLPAIRNEEGIVKNLLPEYIQINQVDFRQQMKKDIFWDIRVDLEKEVLNSLSLFPNLIFSPLNVIINLTRRYDNFFELIYLLSENFPTLSMQRLMFSSYLIEP